jgi:outer membrane protein insertion porin family
MREQSRARRAARARPWIAAAVLAGAVGAQEAPAGAASQPGARRAQADEPRSEQEPAARPVVGAIRVVGNRRTTAEQLIGAFGQRAGAELVSESELRRGLQVLFDTFRVRAQVELEPLAAGSHEVGLLLRVEELELDLELRITGNVAIDDEKVREWAGVGEREELYLYQAPRIRNRLLQRYREEGFLFVEVRVVERPAGTDADTGEAVAPDVIFEIQEGPEVKVRAVVLHGNDSLRDGGFLFLKRGLSKLAKVELRSPFLWRLFAKDFVQETLEADIAAMRRVYRDLGFLDAVVELERLEFSADREWVTIHVAIEEGEQFLVETLDFVALQRVRDANAPGGYREEPSELEIPAEELRAKTALKVGEPYLQRKVDEDHRVIRELYGQRGRVEHPSLQAWEGFRFLDPELAFDQEEAGVRVTYRLVQGEPITIGEILVRGNLHTQDRVIRRLVTVQPGGLANPAEIERSRARIEATGFFSPDTFHPDLIPPQVRYVDTGDPRVKDLEFLVEEGGVLGFELSGGVSTTTGAFGQIRLRKGNFDLGNLPSSFGDSIEEIARLEAFHGAGQTLRIEAAPGTEVTRYTLAFFEPDILRSHVRNFGLGLDASSLRRRYESHLEERRDYSVRLTRQLTPDSSAWIRYGIGSVDVSDLDTGGEPSLSAPLAVPADLKAQEGANDLGYLSIGYGFDTVDNRIIPRNGVDVDFRASVYDEVLGSDFEFAEGEVQLDTYVEFDRDPDVVSDYVHLGFQLGVGAAFGDSDEIPYTERAFFGGRQMRGFDFRGIGPNENGYPIGGSTSLYGTLEYRHPLVKNIQPGSYREVEALQVGAFLDVGVLDPDEFSLDLDELRASTGFLFGISFPLPLTFSFGFPLRSGEDDDEQVFEFDIGF